MGSTETNSPGRDAQGPQVSECNSSGPQAFVNPLFGDSPRARGTDAEVEVNPNLKWTPGVSPGATIRRGRRSSVMRKLEVVSLALVLALASVAVAEAAVPQLTNYQGILRNNSGQPLPDSTYSIMFRLYDAETGGTVLWDESQSVSTTSGLFNVMLGSIEPISEADFAGEAYLSFQIDSGPESSTRARIASVAYAFQSGNADKLDGLDAAEISAANSAPGVFRASLENFSGTVTAFGPIGRVRHITQINTWGEIRISISIGGALAIRFGWNGGWATQGGAGLEVGPSEIVEVSLDGGVGGVLIMGYEYYNGFHNRVWG